MACRVGLAGLKVLAWWAFESLMDEVNEADLRLGDMAVGLEYIPQ
jgi:hypothetical protein